MKIDFEEIQELFETGNLSEISRKTEIPLRTLENYKYGKSKNFEKMKDSFIKLQEYINNKENAKMKFESVNSIIFDEANNWYEIELMTEDNKLAYIRVDADDHSKAANDEHYFDNKELIEKIIDEALEDGEVIYE